MHVYKHDAKSASVMLSKSHIYLKVVMWCINEGHTILDDKFGQEICLS